MKNGLKTVVFFFANQLVMLGLLILAGCNLAPQPPATKTPTAENPVIKSMQATLLEHPDSTLLVDALIDTLKSFGAYDLAYQWCDTLIRKDSSTNFVYKLVQAELMESKNDLPKAMDAYQEYLRYFPQEYRIHLSLAHLMAQSGDSTTLQYLDLIRDRFPNREVKTSVSYLHGVYWNSLHQYDKARQHLDDAILMDYAFPQAYYEKGLSYFDQKRYQDAVNTFRKMTEVAPKDADGWYWLGKSYEASLNKPEAIAAYQRSILQNPRLVEATQAINRLSK